MILKLQHYWKPNFITAIKKISKLRRCLLGSDYLCCPWGLSMTLPMMYSLWWLTLVNYIGGNTRLSGHPDGYVCCDGHLYHFANVACLIFRARINEYKHFSMGKIPHLCSKLRRRFSRIAVGVKANTNNHIVHFYISSLIPIELILNKTHGKNMLSLVSSWE